MSPICGYEGPAGLCGHQAIWAGSLKIGQWWVPVFLCDDHVEPFSRMLDMWGRAGTVIASMQANRNIVSVQRPHEWYERPGVAATPFPWGSLDQQPKKKTTFTCDVCGQPIVRQNDQWVVVATPMQYHNEADAKRVNDLLNHEHYPG